MKEFQHLIIETQGPVTTIILNRPEVRNAINALLIEELNIAFSELDKNESVKIIQITGSNNTFCSGADLNWLKEIKNYSYDENYEDSKKLVELLHTIKSVSKPTIAIIKGAAVGGGVGIMLSCDFIFAENNTKFGVSEVTIGIIPAAIIHLLIERIGITKAKEYLISGKRIDAATAQRIGLINYTLPDSELEAAITELTNTLIKNGPAAMAKVKEMIRKVPHFTSEELADYISHTIAELRISKEGQEGISAFLEKRKPAF